MNESLEKLLWLVAGAMLTYVVQRLLHSRAEKKKVVRVRKLAFQGLPDFHKKMFFGGLTNENWEKGVPEQLRNSCMTFVFFLECNGRATIKDLKVMVDARNNSGIVAHMFQVDRPIICNRLKTTKIEDKQLIASWDHIHPGEAIELHVLVAGLGELEDVDIDVDGEGVEVRRPLFVKKSMQAMMSVEQIPESWIDLLFPTGDKRQPA